MNTGELKMTYLRGVNKTVADDSSPVGMDMWPPACQKQQQPYFCF